MWLSQQILETISQHIGTIITCPYSQKDTSVIPSVLLVDFIFISLLNSGVYVNVMIITLLHLN